MIALTHAPTHTLMHSDSLTQLLSGGGIIRHKYRLRLHSSSLSLALASLSATCSLTRSTTLSYSLKGIGIGAYSAYYSVSESCPHSLKGTLPQSIDVRKLILSRTSAIAFTPGICGALRWHPPHPAAEVLRLGCRRWTNELHLDHSSSCREPRERCSTARVPTRT